MVEQFTLGPNHVHIWEPPEKINAKWDIVISRIEFLHLYRTLAFSDKCSITNLCLMLNSQYLFREQHACTHEHKNGIKNLTQWSIFSLIKKTKKLSMLKFQQNKSYAFCHLFMKSSNGSDLLFFRHDSSNAEHLFL